MAASGGHWQKVSSGTLEGKRIFVPKDVSSWAVVAAKEEGMTYGQYQASFKKAKKANEADIENYQAGIAQNAPAPKAFAKPEPGSLAAVQQVQGQAYQVSKAKITAGVDMFGNAIPAAKAPAAKAPGKSQGSTTSAKTVEKKAQLDTMGYGTFGSALQAATSLSAGTGKAVSISVGEYLPAGGVQWKLQTGNGIFQGILKGTNLYVVKTKPLTEAAAAAANAFGDFKVTLTQYKT